MVSSHLIPNPQFSNRTTRQLSILQTNLRHSRTASASLAQLVSEQKYDVVLIQEPYVILSNVLTIQNIAPSYVAYHSLDRDHAYGAVILIRLAVALEGRVTNRSLSNYAAAVDICLPGGSLRIVSLYIRHSCSNPSALFRDIITSLWSKNMLFGLDANSRNVLWNSSKSDRKGMALEEVFTEFNLTIINDKLSNLDFVPAGTSYEQEHAMVELEAR